MSKSKPKDKKNEAQGPLQKELDDRKREILDATFTIRKLQERLDRLILENKDLNDRYDSLRASNQEEIQKLKIIIDSKQEEIRTSLIKTSNVQIELKNKDRQIEDLQKSLSNQFAYTDDLMDQKNKEVDQLRQGSTTEIRSLENKLKEFEIYMSEKDQMEKERAQLREALEFEKAEKIRELADKERERVQATDKLKNDMLHKIQETKTNLLSLKKEQLSTTTRLTVLQNHQLTSELEYQSKQTEKLLFKNEQLQNKVTNLQRDLEIHKQVEQELAKRSHFSRGIIKKLSQRVKQLEEDSERRPIAEPQRSPETVNSRQKDDRRRHEIISAMESNLEELEKKNSKLQNQYDLLKNENNYLQTRLEEHESKVEKIGGLLVKYLDDITDNKVDAKDDKYVYDLRHLKRTDVKDWGKQDVTLTVTLLLNLVKPLLTVRLLFMKKRNVSLVIPTIKKTLLVTDEEENADTLSTALPRLPQDISSSNLERRTQIKSRLQEMPVNIATKIVGSSLREWGRTVGTGGNNASSSINLSRKYKVGESLK